MVADLSAKTPAGLVGTDACYSMADVASSSRLITNGSTTQPLTLAGWVPARRGADDFLRHRSFGAGC